MRHPSVRERPVGRALVDWTGQHLVERGDTPQVAPAAISLERVKEHRRRFAAPREADGFVLDAVAEPVVDDHHLRRG